MPRNRYPDVPAESFEGLDAWANQLVPCVSAAELDGLISGHRKTAADRQLSAGCRRLAKLQADALERARPKPRPKKKSAKPAG